jgi:hypothetical protein
MRRVDLQVNGLPIDALVVPCYPSCLRLNLPSDLLKIVISSPGDVVKLGPLLLSFDASRCVRDMNLVVAWLVVAIARKVDELENERPPRYDAAASWQEVSTNNVLQYRGLSG